MRRMRVVTFDVEPHQWEMTEIGQAAWLSCSQPSRVYFHHLENIHICYFFQFCISREWLCWFTNCKVTIYSIHSSEMSGRSCVVGLQDVLVKPSVFLSRGTLAKGGSIPCHSWKSITQYVLAVLIVYYICRT